MTIDEKRRRHHGMLPGSIGTPGEPAETLSLIQTDEGTRIPVILARRAFRESLAEWSGRTHAAEGVVSISTGRPNLLRVLEHPGDAVDTILDRCAHIRFEPSAKERQILLALQPHEATSCETCCLH